MQAEIPHLRKVRRLTAALGRCKRGAGFVLLVQQCGKALCHHFLLHLASLQHLSAPPLLHLVTIIATVWALSVVHSGSDPDSARCKRSALN